MQKINIIIKTKNYIERIEPEEKKKIGLRNPASGIKRCKLVIYCRQKDRIKNFAK